MHAQASKPYLCRRCCMQVAVKVCSSLPPPLQPCCLGAVLHVGAEGTTPTCLLPPREAGSLVAVLCKWAQGAGVQAGWSHHLRHEQQLHPLALVVASALLPGTMTPEDLVPVDGLLIQQCDPGAAACAHEGAACLLWQRQVALAALGHLQGRLAEHGGPESTVPEGCADAAAGTLLAALPLVCVLEEDAEVRAGIGTRTGAIGGCH